MKKKTRWRCNRKLQNFVVRDVPTQSADLHFSHVVVKFLVMWPRPTDKGGRINYFHDDKEMNDSRPKGKIGSRPDTQVQACSYPERLCGSDVHTRTHVHTIWKNKKLTGLLLKWNRIKGIHISTFAYWMTGRWQQWSSSAAAPTALVLHYITWPKSESANCSVVLMIYSEGHIC